MGAAALQGCPVVTHDLDLWIGAPLNQHDRVLLACHKVGAQTFDDFHVQLADGTLINFTYEMSGLRSFAAELKQSVKLKLRGRTIPVLPLPRIYASKRTVNRPKDKAHLLYLRQMMRLQKKLRYS